MSEIYSAPITVLGAGSYGTALAIALSRNGHKTYLWGHNPDKMAVLASERMNQDFLPDIVFPEALEIVADLATAVQKSKDLLIVVPSHVFSEVLAQIKPFLSQDHRIMWATKGLERDTGRLLQTVAKEILGKFTRLRCFPVRLLPKNWRQACQQRFRLPQLILFLPIKCKNGVTVPKRSEFTSTMILSVCNSVGLLKM